jgi:hypothetical protein
MTMTEPHATEAPGPGEVADHEDHGHADEELGPIDVAAWGAGIVGVGIAGVIAACFVLATSGIG